jgi:phosphoglycerate dehydrogenase-like enzyme
MRDDDRPLVLAMAGVPQKMLDELSRDFGLVGPVETPIAKAVPNLAKEQISGIRVLLTRGSSETSREAMAALPNLGLIACIGAGCDGLDLGAARELGIWVTNSPGVGADSVADLAVALLIAVTRKMCDSNRSLRVSGLIEPWPPTTGLTGRRAGIYGLGAIGSRVARRLSAMGMLVAYSGRKSRPDVQYPPMGSLLELAEWADSLVVCVPATEQTVGSIDANILAALGPEGHIVNVSRGSIVDTEALCRALETGLIAGAGLDVFDPKYLDRLLALPSAVLTPHIGGSTTQAEAAMCDMVSRNMAAFLGGTEPITPVFRVSQARR